MGGLNEDMTVTQNSDDLTGTWHCAYWYPSNSHNGEDVSEYSVIAHRKGTQIIMESEPNELHAYIFVRLSIEDNLATGTWHETTSPQGEFKGMIYSGAVQLLISEDGKRMTGKWVGVGRDHEKNAVDIFGGRWELTRR